MIIRRLRESDWEEYRSLRLEALRLEPEAFGSDYSEYTDRPPEYWQSRAAGTPDLFILGAFRDDRLVGTVGIAREQGIKGRHKAWIIGVYVSPAARGTGIGRQLLGQMIAEARELDGLVQLILGVGTGNTPARQLYLAAGFQVYGTEPRALLVNGRYVDEDLMYLAL